MKYQQHHSQQNLVKNQLWFNEKTKWELSMQSWNQNNSWHQKHNKLYWMICYKDNCIIHLSEKKEEYFLKTFKNYREKKEMRWITWNVERAKTFYQVNEFLKKSDDKSKFLKTEWEKMKKWVKTTSFWWKQKIIYNLKSVAWWLALTKDSEKHHESEKSKKKLAQELSSDASEISINQQVQIKQKSEKDNLKKMFIEEDEDWYETVLQKIKKLEIQENKKLMICKWSHWITCHNNEYEEHHKMKKQNQYYSQEFWKCASQDKKKWSKKSLYKISVKK